MKFKLTFLLLLIINSISAQTDLKNGMNTLIYKNYQANDLIIKYLLIEDSLLIEYSVDIHAINDSLQNALMKINLLSNDFSTNDYFTSSDLNQIYSTIGISNKNLICNVTSIDTFLIGTDKIYKYNSGVQALWLDLQMEEYKGKKQMTKTNDSIWEIHYFSWPSLRLYEKETINNNTFYHFIYDDPNIVDEEYSFILQQDFWIINYLFDSAFDFELIIVNGIEFKTRHNKR